MKKSRHSTNCFAIILALGLVSCSFTNPEVLPPGVFVGKVIANWDFVPYQRISGVVRPGVVAFHENGVNVIFTVNGGTPMTVTAPTKNPDSGVFEYFIVLDPTDYPAGEIIVSAKVVPDQGASGEERSLEPLVLYSGEPNGTTVWADCNSGDDDTGTGTQAAPYKTIEKAYHEAGSGGTVYCKTGSSYTLSTHLGSAGYNRWTTITCAPGLAAGDVQILAGSTTRFGENFVKFGNVTIYMDEAVPSYRTLMYFEPSHKLWFQGTILENRRGHLLPTTLFNDQGAHYWMSGCVIKNFGNSSGYWMKDCTIQNIGSDAYRARSNGCLINVLIDNMDPYTGAHPDMVQWYNPNGRVDNMILYNVRAFNIKSQGLFGEGGDNTAIVNVLIEKNNTSNYTMQLWDQRHLLIWHSTFYNIGLLIRGPETNSNWDVRNSTFEVMDTDTTVSLNNLTQSIIRNNHFRVLNWNQTVPMGEGAVMGDPKYTTPALINGIYHTMDTVDYHPGSGSPLKAAGLGLECVPGDALGAQRSSVPSIGAFE